MTADEALANAVRLFRAAEMETNLVLMERMERLGDSWMSMAGMLRVHDWTLEETGPPGGA